MSLKNNKHDSSSQLLAAYGDSPIHLLVAGFAACGGKAGNQQKHSCELL